MTVKTACRFLTIDSGSKSAAETGSAKTSVAKIGPRSRFPGGRLMSGG